MSKKQKIFNFFLVLLIHYVQWKDFIDSMHSFGEHGIEFMMWLDLNSIEKETCFRTTRKELTLHK